MFDTMEYVDSLIAAGVEEKQAKAQASALKRAINDSAVTKSEFAEFRAEVRVGFRVSQALGVAILVAVIVGIILR